MQVYQLAASKEETRTTIEQQADGYLIKARITPKKQLVGILDSIA
ncbi:MAG: hypothetical protein WCJ24_03310 [Candidatus Saccharibacteria bacterium]